jgi:hypothetical protein
MASAIWRVMRSCTAGARKDLNEPRDFAEPDHLALGNISHVYLTEERQHVMFAQRTFTSFTITISS